MNESTGGGKRGSMRFRELDALRGIAIILMVLFHLLWDLNYFGLMHLSLYAGALGIMQKITAGLFLFLSGIVLTINYKKHEKNFVFYAARRAAIIFGAGMGLTIATMVFFPQEVIYFGVLHLIGLSALISIPVIKGKKSNLLLGLLVISIPAFMNIQDFGIQMLSWIGLAYPAPSLDFFPVIPWIGTVLLGIGAGNIFYKSYEPSKTSASEGAPAEFLLMLGRNSLIIYFLHQPILMLILYSLFHITPIPALILH